MIGLKAAARFVKKRFSSRIAAVALSVCAVFACSQARAQVVTYTTDFESSEGYTLGSLQGQNTWQVPQGAANVVNTAAFSGTQSVSLLASTPPTVVSQSFSQFTGQQIIFVDFYAKPTANADVTQGTIIDAGTSRAGFATVASSGTIYAFDGDGTGGGSWVATTASVPIDQFGQSQNWIRFTFRQDYSAKLWSLYVNGALVDYNLGFRDNTSGVFSAFSLQAPAASAAALDDFYVSSLNPLYADLNNNGIDDSWEMKYLGSLAYGANDDPGGIGRPLIQSYQLGLSPWPAATISSGLQVWYRADLGVAKDSSNNVSLWADLSGNGSHVVQTATPSLEPTWTSNVSALFGNPAVQFNGSDVLATASAVNPLAGSSDQTVVAVVVPGSTQQAYSSIVDLSADTSHGFVLGEQGTQTNQYELWWMDSGQSGWFSSPSVTATTGTVQVIAITKSGASATAYLNGVAQETGSAPATIFTPTAALAVGNRVSASDGFTGQIAEVLVYNRALSSTELQQLETQFTTRYVNPDSNGNGIPDVWEMQYLGTLSHAAGDDPGGVGRTLLQSYQQGLSPWPTATVSSGLQGWYRADLGVIKDSNNNVSQWTDLTGNGFHVVQSATPSLQPTWSSSVTALYGKPGVQFNGSAVLSTSAAVNVEAGSSDQTVIAVVVPGSTQQAYSSIVDLSADASEGFVLGEQGTQTNQYVLWWMPSSLSGWQSSPSVTASAGQPQIIAVSKSGASASSYLNGVVQRTGSAPATIVTPIAKLAVGNRVSATYGFNGQVGEVLVYNRALSASELQQVETQLASRYVNPDSNGNRIPDTWEMQYLGTLSHAAGDDPGGVGRTILQSYQQGLSPWPTPTVPGGLQVWYRADLGIGMDANNNVSLWADLTGNGSHLVQTSNPSLEPSWSGNVSSLFGHPGIDFNGSDVLATSAAVNLLAGSSDQTVIAVVAPAATQKAYSSIVDLSSSISNGFVLGEHGTQTNQYELWWMDSGQTGWYSSPGATASAGQPGIISVTKSGATASTYLNGVLQGTGAAPATILTPTAALAVGNRVGGGYGYTGQIGEVLVYNRALSSSERSQVETQLITRYVNPNSNGSAIPDAWEEQFLGTLTYSASADPGGVGRTLLQSYQQGLSPWPAAAVSSGLRAWYRAGLGVIKDANSDVSLWADLTGNSFHLGQTGGTSLEPLWVASAANSQAAIQFNGTNLLKTSAAVDEQASSTDITVITVSIPASTQLAYGSMVDLSSDTAHGFVVGQAGSATNQEQLWFMDAGQSGWNSSPAATETAGQGQILSVIKSGTSALTFLNGAAQGTNTVPQTMFDPVAILSVGGRASGQNGFSGQIAEVLVYNRALSSAERQSAEAALTNTYFLAQPAITSAPSAPGQVGQAFSYQITASNSPTTFAATSLPPGLSVNPANGLISGTPTTVGIFNSSVSATNAAGTGSASVSFTVGSPAGSAIFNSNGTFVVPTGVTSVNVLVVAGGGGGGGPGTGEQSGRGGGGGGGVFFRAGYPVAQGGTFPITVGAGGANDASGGNSIFGSVTMNGGGRGATTGTSAGSGGSGGGGNYNQIKGLGINGQGFDGGYGYTDNATYAVGGGGGGAAAQGVSPTGGMAAGNGGNGLANSITGTAVYYGAGGGGGGDDRHTYATGGSGGLGGGGAGATAQGATGGNGAPNTGCGGGGGGRGGVGGSGGSGAVLITWVATTPTLPAITSPTTASANVGVSYSYQITATGSPVSFAASSLPPGLSINVANGLISGVPTTAGTFNSTVYASNAYGTGNSPVTFNVTPDTGGAIVFTSNGTFIVPQDISTVRVLVVGGGGGGGGIYNAGEPSGRGGGGGGGVVYNASYAVTPGASINVLIGGGGPPSGADSNYNGGFSSFGSLSADGGGGGATSTSPAGSSATGGGGNYAEGPGSELYGEGYNGGAGYTDNATYSVGGGGGGAGKPGGGVTANGKPAGNGGDGVLNSITGSPVYYGGGGGGGGDHRQSFAIGGSGGQGGGGFGATADGTAGFNGTDHVGGGGGGGAYNGFGGNGGSGVVIVSWSPTLPVITSSTNASATVGVPFTYQTTALNSPSSFSASGLPPGLSINPATGLISGTPISAGSSSVGLTATNPVGPSTAVLAITVSGAASAQSLITSTSFEVVDGFSAGSLSGQNGWTVSQGTASISTVSVHSGTQALELAAGSSAAIATLPFAAESGETLEFCDFYALPAAETAIASSTLFTVEGATFGFQQSNGQATLEAFQGNGSGGGTWAPTSFSVPLGTGNQLASWVRLSARLDFTQLTWDLYVNGKMVAADIPFTSNSSTYLSKLQIQGDTSTPSLIDDLLVESTNPIFADVNNDGIDSAWLTQYFGTTSINPNADYTGNGETVIQDYAAGINPMDYFKGRAFAILPGNFGNTYTYDLSGRLIKTSYANGVNIAFSNDNAGNIASVSNYGAIVAWRLAYSLSPDGTGTGADTAVLGGDAIPNLAKYAFGLNPHSTFSGDCPQVSITSFSGGYLVLTYTRPDPAPADLAYTVQVSGDGINWSSGSGATVNVSTTVSNGTATVVVRDATPIGTPSFGRQIRLVLQRVPQP